MKEISETKNEFVIHTEALTETARPSDKYDEHARHEEIEIYNFVGGGRIQKSILKATSSSNRKGRCLCF